MSSVKLKKYQWWQKEGYIKHTNGEAWYWYIWLQIKKESNKSYKWTKKHWIQVKLTFSIIRTGRELSKKSAFPTSFKYATGFKVNLVNMTKFTKWSNSDTCFSVFKWYYRSVSVPNCNQKVRNALARNSNII